MLRRTSGPDKPPAEQVIKDIRRAARRPFSAGDRIRIVLKGLRGDQSESRDGDRGYDPQLATT